MHTRANNHRHRTATNTDRENRRIAKRYPPIGLQPVRRYPGGGGARGICDIVELPYRHCGEVIACAVFFIAIGSKDVRVNRPPNAVFRYYSFEKNDTFKRIFIIIILCSFLVFILYLFRMVFHKYVHECVQVVAISLAQHNST